MTDHDLHKQPLSATELFAGRYQIERMLGSGGMGEVYLARDMMLEGEHVALKVLHRALSGDKRLTKRFVREVQLARKVTDSHVVRTFDAGQTTEVGSVGRLYLTMEYASGRTLRDEVGKNALTWSKTAPIISEIAQGLAAIHAAEIIHRDLKPSNIIVTKSGGIKITDFGVARPGDSSLTGHSEVIGSGPFMAPEVWTGKDVGPAVDLYALGVIWYCMLTAQNPFDANSPAETMARHLDHVPPLPSHYHETIPTWIDEAVMSLLAKRNVDRPVNAQAVVRFIEAHISGHSVALEVDRTPRPERAPVVFDDEVDPDDYVRPEHRSMEPFMEAPAALDAPDTPIEALGLGKNLPAAFGLFGKRDRGVNWVVIGRVVGGLLFWFGALALVLALNGIFLDGFLGRRLFTNFRAQQLTLFFVPLVLMAIVGSLPILFGAFVSQGAGHAARAFLRGWLLLSIVVAALGWLLSSDGRLAGPRTITGASTRETPLTLVKLSPAEHSREMLLRGVLLLPPQNAPANLVGGSSNRIISQSSGMKALLPLFISAALSIFVMLLALLGTRARFEFRRLSREELVYGVLTLVLVVVVRISVNLIASIFPEIERQVLPSFTLGVFSLQQLSFADIAAMSFSWLFLIILVGAAALHRRRVRSAAVLGELV